MSQAQQAANECLVGRSWPDCLDRRVAKPSEVDIDPTVPARRATDSERMAYRLAEQAHKHARERQYAAASPEPTGHGDLE